MNKKINIIKNTTLLNSLSEETIRTNLENMKFRIVTYKKDNILHFDGEVCYKLEIILSGKVAVERIDESGDFLTISTFSDDDVLGGNLLFSKDPYYPMTVSTRSDTEILEISKEALFELLCHNSTLLLTYLEFVSDHAFILGDKIKHYVKRTIRESVMSYLEYESKKQNSDHIKLRITKKELAERIGVQRTSLSRELAKMKKDGLILFDASSITLLR